MKDLIRYVSELQATLDRLPMDRIEQAITILQDARLAGRTIFVMGNGGSASTASHLVCDLAKNTRHAEWPPFRVIGLADNMAIFSAFANDEGYDQVFSQQLANLVNEGDIVLGISASGNSPNVLRAIELAKERGATTIGFTGFDGGRLGPLVDVNVHVASQRIEHVEDIHLMLEHMITARLRQDLGQELVSWEMADEAASAAPAMEVLARPGVQASRIPPEAVLDLGAEAGEVANGLLRRMLPLAAQCVNCSSGCTVLVDEQGKFETGMVVFNGELREAPGRQLADTVEKGLAGWVVQNRKPAIIHNTLEDPRWLRRTWDDGDPESKSAICVPLVSGDQILGVLTLVCPGPGRFKDEDLVVVTALANGISQVAAKARASRNSGNGRRQAEA